MTKKSIIAEKVKNTLIEAASVSKTDKLAAYSYAIEQETKSNSRWALEQLAENCKLARDARKPLCDDTGIPHLILEIGPQASISGSMIEDIRLGIAQGLAELPGRPMAVLGDDKQRLVQSAGLSSDPADVVAAPIMIAPGSGDVVRLHILMMGGGPTIRARTNRVFHMHSIDTIMNEIVAWATEAVDMLGCTPSTLGIGIGRSHYEAAALMLMALADGCYDVQTPLEKEICERVNQGGTGALGLGGDMSVFATFLKVGPQRASGIRAVSLQPCCCFEPRVAVTDLEL